MAEPLEQSTLLTLRVTRGELRTIKNNARARGLNMTEWLRQLLAAQGVDLEPQQ
jgi:predicted DNA binding CopG/RHH family protein